MTNKQHVRIVSEPFPPYFGPSLAHNGWMAHIVRDAFATQDISVEFDFTVWTRALKQAKEQQQTILLGAYKTPEREKRYIYSCAFAHSSTGLYRHIRSKANFQGDITSLNNSLLVTGREYATGTQALAQVNVGIVKVAQIAEGFKLLANQRVEWLIAPKEVADYYLSKSRYADRITFDPPEIEVNLMHLALSRDDANAKELVHQFHNGLQTLIRTQKLRDILKLHNFTLDQQRLYEEQLARQLNANNACFTNI